ncbi:hypothetical protein BDV95DRAFT_606362 [Massariosphaeria phaeospora]|uniref:Uncharacterized protein n=1 Tax=Massariosphaeria phaeospora TaxID=100035 RepID=A0A7C8IFE9_9PLEO|nr:hypothetical protein BDV95DRAFT_606362 [Massariosphaeria phaeospora]
MSLECSHGDPQSPFLQLPGDIRNSIYEFAFYCPDGLFCTEKKEPDGSRKLVITGSDHEEFNTLKFVCRQLYWETAGLELKSNQICFRPSQSSEHNANRTSPTLCIPLFFHFVETCTPSRLAWLTNVTIKEWDTYSEPERCVTKRCYEYINSQCDRIVDLQRFCVLHPKISVTFVIPGFGPIEHLRTAKFVWLGLALTRLLRGVDLIPTFPQGRLMRRPNAKYDAMSESAQRLVGGHHVENLRYMPPRSGWRLEDEEEMLQRSFVKDFGRLVGFLDTPARRLRSQAYLAFAMKLLQDGI